MIVHGAAPRLEIDLTKISYNASVLVSQMNACNISITGVTKAFMGLPQIAQAFLKAGVQSLGDSRIENIERMRDAGITEPMVLIRSPMMSQVDRVVASADISVNTEILVLTALSKAAVSANKTHGVLLMVELGDLREGVLLKDIESLVKKVCELPNIKFMGLGANLACNRGVSPDDCNMSQLSIAAGQMSEFCKVRPMTISGGNSANLSWVFSGGKTGRINNLRLGESILLGRETLHRKVIAGLHTDAIKLVAEVIESKRKPSNPWGEIAQSAFNNIPGKSSSEEIVQSILAIGRQDVDPEGLHSDNGHQILGASSDHLIIDAGSKELIIGSSVSFQLNYSALLRAMTSPYIKKVFSRSDGMQADHNPLAPPNQHNKSGHFVHL